MRTLGLGLLLAALAAPPASAADVEVRWLGVAGFSISSGGATATRAGALWSNLCDRPGRRR